MKYNLTNQKEFNAVLRHLVLVFVIYLEAEDFFPVTDEQQFR
jgi:hypothetical protein